MSHIASAVLMVQPTTFGYDAETAKTNAFQHHPNSAAAAVTARAGAEFEGMVAKLRAAGITVVVFRDPANEPKPNAVFPNNWLSTWADGRIFLYPMATASRRVERTPAALSFLADHFKVTTTLDFSDAEQTGRYLEGTGALVFDHEHKLAYAALSPRCDEQLAREHIQSLGYQPVIFSAFDQAGTAIYHTNVVMAIQATTAVLCAEAITDKAERQRVIKSLGKTGHEVVTITPEQMNQFCGNVMELQNAAGERCLVLSQTAFDAFTSDQRATLSQDKTLLSVAIPTIETVGGGSARCMVAEIFLPPAAKAN